MLDNTAGYDHRGTTIETLVNKALFHEEHRQMVVVKDINIFSMCEHHMLPFFGAFCFVSLCHHCLRAHLGERPAKVGDLGPCTVDAERCVLEVR